MIKLSFIIPVYNVGKYISTTLDSILNNEFNFEYEIIVINDGSTDNSQHVVSSYVEKHNNIVLINNTNHGVSYSRNCGIDHAKGKYITFVDGDDTINTNTYAQMVEKIEQNSYAFVQCNFATIYRSGKRKYSQFCETATEVTDREDYFSLFFSSNKFIHNACWGKIINRECISNIRFDETLAVAEDQKFVFDILCYAERILLMNEVGYEYYQRDNSAMHTMSVNKCMNKISALETFADQCNSDSALVYINYQKLLVLTELYNLMIKRSHKQCKEIKSKLMKTATREIHKMLSKRNKIKVFMICKINFVYRMAVKLFY